MKILELESIVLPLVPFERSVLSACADVGVGVYSSIGNSTSSSSSSSSSFSSRSHAH